LPLAPAARWPEDTLATAESPYNFLRVARHGDILILYLNDGAAQTVARRGGGRTGYYYDDFALGPLLVDGRRALVLGMGAGGTIAAARRTAPELDIDAVELDPEVVAAAFRWFGLAGDDPRLRIHIDDARRWLARHGGRYDLVQLDVYQGSPYIPFYLDTVEFFALVRAHMSDDGLLMMNLFDIGERRELLMATAASLRRVFPSVLVSSRRNGSHLLFAFAGARSLTGLGERLAATGAAPAAAGLAELIPPADTRPLTDDRAPVEALTRRMLAR